MQQEEKRLNCEHHPESDLSVIYIGDDPSNKSRILCIECVLQGGEQQGLPQIIKIKDFFTNPGIQFRKNISQDIDTYISEINKCIDFVIFLKNFQESIYTHLEQLRQNVKSLKIISSTINYEIEKQSNFNELRNLFQKIKVMDSFQGTQEFLQFQQDLNDFSKNFPKFYKNAVKSIKARQEQSIKDYKQKSYIQKDLSSMSKINIYTTKSMFSIWKIQMTSALYYKPYVMDILIMNCYIKGQEMDQHQIIIGKNVIYRQICQQLLHYEMVIYLVVTVLVNQIKHPKNMLLIILIHHLYSSKIKKKYII